MDCVLDADHIAIVNAMSPTAMMNTLRMLRREYTSCENTNIAASKVRIAI
jgi:hypothetical protein